MKFETPILEVVYLREEDVIRTSGGTVTKDSVGGNTEGEYWGSGSSF